MICKALNEPLLRKNHIFFKICLLVTKKAVFLQPRFTEETMPKWRNR